MRGGLRLACHVDQRHAGEAFVFRSGLRRILGEVAAVDQANGVTAHIELDEAVAAGRRTLPAQCFIKARCFRDVVHAQQHHMHALARRQRLGKNVGVAYGLIQHRQKLPGSKIFLSTWRTSRRPQKAIVRSSSLRMIQAFAHALLAHRTQAVQEGRPM
jgi:hypothetical protein